MSKGQQEWKATCKKKMGLLYGCMAVALVLHLSCVSHMEWSLTILYLNVSGLQGIFVEWKKIISAEKNVVYSTWILVSDTIIVRHLYTCPLAREQWRINISSFAYLWRAFTWLSVIKTSLLVIFTNSGTVEDKTILFHLLNLHHFAQCLSTSLMPKCVVCAHLSEWLGPGMFQISDDFDLKCFKMWVMRCLEEGTHV